MLLFLKPGPFKHSYLELHLEFPFSAAKGGVPRFGRCESHGQARSLGGSRPPGPRDVPLPAGCGVLLGTFLSGACGLLPGLFNWRAVKFRVATKAVKELYSQEEII